MRRMSTKSIIIICLFIIGWAVAMNYQEEIIDFFVDKFYKNDVVIQDANEYYRDYDFDYVQNTDNFQPNNKQELLNVFYTILNSGWQSFTFYCSNDYLECVHDVEQITNNNETLSNFNNYIHPFNNYSIMNVDYNSLGRITVNVDRLYSDNDISIIKNKIDEIYNSIINESMTTEEKIKTIHDYIVNNTKYDTQKEVVSLPTDKFIKYKFDSNKATGPLLYGVAICGGYTDLMELFLEKMNIESYKISTAKHIWNYINLNGEWKHLDLTWDNPVTSDGSKNLTYTFYLIDTKTLLSVDSTEHNFDTSIFGESE